MTILLMYSTHVPSSKHVETLRSMGLNVVVARDEQHAVALAPEVNIVFGHRYLRQISALAKRLKWVQSTAAGVDRLPLKTLKAMNIVLSRNIYDAEVIALHATAMSLGLVRAIAFEREGGKNYEFRCLPKNALVLGTGQIGKNVATKLKGIGIEFIQGVNQDGRAVRGFDQTWSSENWLQGVPNTGLVIDCLPAGSILLDDIFFGALPESAFFVSVGRIENLVVDAMESALRTGRLAGAALDTEQYFVDGSDDVPNLLLTPHCAAFDEGRGARLENAFESQLQRYLNGKTLQGVVF